MKHAMGGEAWYYQVGVEVQAPHRGSTDNLVEVGDGSLVTTHLIGMKAPTPYLVFVTSPDGGDWNWALLFQPGEGADLGSLLGLCRYGCGGATFFSFPVSYS